MAGKIISHLVSCGLKSAMLGHLSKENNFPELAYKTVVEQLLENNYQLDSIRLSIAKRDTQSPLIDVG